MIVPVSLRQKSGIVYQGRKLDCPNCNEVIEFDLLYYIRESDWPSFRDLTKEVLESISCVRCGQTYEYKSPIIYEITKRNLLVFATYGGDDGGAISGFNTWLEYSGVLLPKDIFEKAKLTPYTFVHGLNGLKALLACFDDKPLPPVQGPFNHKTTSDIYFHSLGGYIYGKLFFYYPSEIGIYDLSVALLSFSAINDQDDYAEKLLVIVERTLTILGLHNVWLVQEAGRLSIQCSQLYYAKKYLNKAVKLQHSWLAVTANYLDATPSRRVDGDTQQPNLPHMAKASTLSNVMQHRHVVIKFNPSEKDYGLWYFQETEPFSIPETYTLTNFLKVHGYVLGALERGIYESELLCNSDSFFSYNALVKHTVHYLDNYDRHDLALLWSEYTSTRWQIESVGADVVFDKLQHEVNKLTADEQTNKTTGLLGFLKSPQLQIRVWEGAMQFIQIG